MAPWMTLLLLTGLVLMVSSQTTPSGSRGKVTTARKSTRKETSEATSEATTRKATTRIETTTARKATTHSPTTTSEATTTGPYKTDYRLSIILNLTYTPLLANQSSPEYQTLSSKIEPNILEFIRTELPDCIAVKVAGFQEGSVIVDSLATFPNDNHTDEEVQRVFNEAVISNNNMLGNIEVLFRSTTTTLAPTAKPDDKPGRKASRPYPCCPRTTARSSTRSRASIPDFSTTTAPSTVNVWSDYSTTAEPNPSGQPDTNTGTTQLNPSNQPGTNTGTAQPNPSEQPGSNTGTADPNPSGQPGTNTGTAQPNPSAQPGTNTGTAQTNPTGQPDTNTGPTQPNPSGPPGTNTGTAQPNPSSQPDTNTGTSQPKPTGQPDTNTGTTRPNPSGQPSTNTGTAQTNPSGQPDTNTEPTHANPSGPPDTNTGTSQPNPTGQPDTNTGTTQPNPSGKPGTNTGTAQTKPSSQTDTNTGPTQPNPSGPPGTNTGTAQPNPSGPPGTNTGTSQPNPSGQQVTKDASLTGMSTEVLLSTTAGTPSSFSAGTLFAIPLEFRVLNLNTSDDMESFNIYVQDQLSQVFQSIPNFVSAQVVTRQGSVYLTDIVFSQGAPSNQMIVDVFYNYLKDHNMYLGTLNIDPYSIRSGDAVPSDLPTTPSPGSNTGASGAVTTQPNPSGQPTTNTGTAQPSPSGQPGTNTGTAQPNPSGPPGTNTGTAQPNPSGQPGTNTGTAQPNPSGPPGTNTGTAQTNPTGQQVTKNASLTGMSTEVLLTTTAGTPSSFSAGTLFAFPLEFRVLNLNTSDDMESFNIYVQDQLSQVFQSIPNFVSAHVQTRQGSVYLTDIVFSQDAPSNQMIVDVFYNYLKDHNMYLGTLNIDPYSIRSGDAVPSDLPTTPSPGSNTGASGAVTTQPNPSGQPGTNTGTVHPNPSGQPGTNTGTAQPNPSGQPGTNTGTAQPNPSGQPGTNTGTAQPNPTGQPGTNTGTAQPNPSGRPGTNTGTVHPNPSGQPGTNTGTAQPNPSGQPGTNTGTAQPNPTGQPGTNTGTAQPNPSGQPGTNTGTVHPNPSGQPGTNTGTAQPKPSGQQGTNTGTAQPNPTGQPGTNTGTVQPNPTGQPFTKDASLTGMSTEVLLSTKAGTPSSFSAGTLFAIPLEFRVLNLNTSDNTESFNIYVQDQLSEVFKSIPYFVSAQVLTRQGSLFITDIVFSQDAPSNQMIVDVFYNYLKDHNMYLGTLNIDPYSIRSGDAVPSDLPTTPSPGSNTGASGGVTGKGQTQQVTTLSPEDKSSMTATTVTGGGAGTTARETTTTKTTTTTTATTTTTTAAGGAAPVSDEGVFPVYGRVILGLLAAAFIIGPIIACLASYTNLYGPY
ncbi:mucin-2-like [Dendropsophus ebraccatus]|uniref:mucin-2-like n=1 Tax=Dendropsophus ebraccatus TaxID=150705 RepID=UPI003831C2F5